MPIRLDAAMAEAPAPALVGELPEEYRELFIQPLPGTDMSPAEAGVSYTGRWFYDDRKLRTEYAPAEMEHLMPVLEAAFRLGGLALGEGEHLEARIAQGVPQVEGLGSTVLHQDIAATRYRRLILSDTHGTAYRTGSGEYEEAPDFGMLVIDSGTYHKAQSVPEGTTRTLLQLTRLPDTYVPQSVEPRLAARKRGGLLLGRLGLRGRP